jgi:murein DD-endopeptidase MepM/ murein hydrolase activator NlpD
VAFGPRRTNLTTKNFTKTLLGPTRYTAGGAWGLGRIDGYPISGNISSRFGPRGDISTPVGTTTGFHYAIDIPAPAGTLVLSPAEGVVTYQRTSVQAGNTVVVRHPDGTASYFTHLEAGKAMIGQGMKVRRGDIIGFVGTTGYSTGNHLHYGRLRSVADGQGYFTADQWMDPLSNESNMTPVIPEPVVPAEVTQPTDARIARFREEALVLELTVRALRSSPIDYDAALAAVQRELGEMLQALAA